MGACGGYQVGKTYLVDRTSLLRFLDQVARTGVVGEALARKRRVCEALDESANFTAAQRTRIQFNSPSLSRMADLPAGVELIAPGKLQITYAGATELLAQIAELAAAAADDFSRFQRLVESRK